MPDEAPDEAQADTPVDAPRRTRRRLWILLGVFVALGGVELIVGILLFAGYAVVNLFRRGGAGDAENEPPAPQPEPREEP